MSAEEGSNAKKPAAPGGKVQGTEDEVGTERKTRVEES